MKNKEKKFSRKPIFVLLLPVIEMFVLEYITGHFFNLNNMLNILYRFSMLGLVVIGMSFVILTGGIDFSVGGQIAFSGMLMAILIIRFQFSYAAAFVIATLTGMLIGYLNGSISIDFKIEPSVETFGMMIILNGLVYTISGGHSIIGEGEIFQFWTGESNKIFGAAFLALFIAYSVSKLLLKKTYPGRFLHVVGENFETAEFIGINSRRVKILAYILCSFMMTITATFTIGYSHVATPFSGSEYMSDSLIACCAGGFSLRGGRGRIEGALMAALILVIFDNGMRILGLNQGSTGFVKAVILLGVLVFNFRRKD